MIGGRERKHAGKVWGYPHHAYGRASAGLCRLRDRAAAAEIARPLGCTRRGRRAPHGEARRHGREWRASALRRSDAGLTAGVAASSAKAGPGTLAVTEDRVFGPGGEAIARRFCTARPAVWRDPFIVDRSCPSDCDIELPAGGWRCAV